MRLAFIDTETTGLNPGEHVVIEFACIIHDDYGEIERFETRIKPTPDEISRAHPKALEVNGYTPEKWEDAPSIEEVGPRIVEILRDSVLVGHNIPFDESMIKAHLSSRGIKGRIPHRKIDTQALVIEHLFPLGLERASMDSVRDFLGWDKEGAHTAMKDVEDTKNLFYTTWRMGPLKRLILFLWLRASRILRRVRR